MAIRIPSLPELYTKNPWVIDFALLFMFFACIMQWMRSVKNKEKESNKFHTFDALAGVIGATLGVVALGRLRTNLAEGVPAVMSFFAIGAGLLLFRHFRNTGDQESNEIFSLAIGATVMCLGLFFVLGSKFVSFLPPNVVFMLNATAIFAFFWSGASVVMHSMHGNNTNKESAEKKPGLFRRLLGSITGRVEKGITRKIEETIAGKPGSAAAGGAGGTGGSSAGGDPTTLNLNIEEPDITIDTEVDTHVENESVAMVLASARRDAAMVAAAAGRRLAKP
ncbi:MAG: hypothetical protein QF486_05145 [Candidatus Woesearchaeota archaeon]|jgi:hypothetical protein|nr:hypothetical protein [Candidatus Woesearchaeota archaeon]MDP7198974.1 hypothetical protein [Candidatus Woesearchaeota archaeon]MDP7467354.1 hypothetical protein [Candidatus Woesearchaeota archaeon]MDP7646592.1 hypothetical protein [Candidatus Woesearchaeota archaeon]